MRCLGFESGIETFSRANLRVIAEGRSVVISMALIVTSEGDRTKGEFSFAVEDAVH